MRFWDSSAIIPLCLEEPQTESIQKLLKQDQHQVVWWGAVIECYSAISRLRREGVISDDEENQAFKLLLMLEEAWTEVEPTEQLKQISRRLLRLHNLKAADSVQLAAALIWAENSPRDQEFVCLDKELSQAAKLEGFILPR